MMSRLGSESSKIGDVTDEPSDISFSDGLTLFRDETSVEDIAAA